MSSHRTSACRPLATEPSSLIGGLPGETFTSKSIGCLPPLLEGYNCLLPTLPFVHCDVKPQNVRLLYVTSLPPPSLLYRRIGAKPEMCMHGTPAYAPPERLTGYCRDSVSGRRMLCPASDVWSLGVLLFEMMAGTLPFRGETFCELVRQVTNCRWGRQRHTAPQYARAPRSWASRRAVAGTHKEPHPHEHAARCVRA
jgi:serine/threonine protein kinase